MITEDGIDKNREMLEIYDCLSPFLSLDFGVCWTRDLTLHLLMNHKLMLTSDQRHCLVPLNSNLWLSKDLQDAKIF